MNQKTKPKSNALLSVIIIIMLGFAMLWQYYINQRLEITIENQGEIMSMIATGNRTNMSNLDMNFRTSAIVETLFGDTSIKKAPKK